MQKSEDEDATKSWSERIKETLKEAARKMGKPDKKWKVSEAIKFLQTIEKFNDFLTHYASCVSSKMVSILQEATCGNRHGIVTCPKSLLL